MTAGHLYELLRPAAGTEVIGAWSNRFASGAAAITARQVGEGTVIYLGAYLTDDLVTHFVPSILSRADVRPLLPDLPEGVRLTDSSCSFSTPGSSQFASEACRTGLTC
jgi:beta-galactosidase